jgi:hypothetical protein
MILFSVYLGANLFVIILPSFLLYYCNGVIFPNCLGKCLGIFTESAGAASAVLETFFGIGTFFMSLIAILLKNTTQLPVAITFACLSILGLMILQKHQLKARECLFIDDNSDNVEAAMKLGMNGIVFENPEQLIVALEKHSIQINGNYREP